jgi:hypothetical protein
MFSGASPISSAESSEAVRKFTQVVAMETWRNKRKSESRKSKMNTGESLTHGACKTRLMGIVVKPVPVVEDSHVEVDNTWDRRAQFREEISTTPSPPSKVDFIFEGVI